MEQYKKQVALLLNVIPEVAKESCFALHGGTAINLFLRNMPRLSVDIDLTYIPVEDRAASFEAINLSLEKIKNTIEAYIPFSKVIHQKELLKLHISNDEAQIKLEVNQGMRGLIYPIEKRVLCEAAQEQFDIFCAIDVVAIGQLYGGKLVAALDRQHPRDLFDVNLLLAKEGFTDEVKIGFLYALLSSKRPIAEILFPNFIDQSQTFITQFEGMTKAPFNYEDFEAVRSAILPIIYKSLDESDKAFIIQFENVTPDWNYYNFQSYPAVQWKLKNLAKLKQDNPIKHKLGVTLLQDKLSQLD
jgi:predicted nucleotidyltransferase component of viral defense system